MPEPFALKRICPHEFVAQNTLDEIADDGTTSGPRSNGHSLDPVVGLNPQHRRIAIVWSARKAFTPRELRSCTR
jgi:hypothetical protein